MPRGTPNEYALHVDVEFAAAKGAQNGPFWCGIPAQVGVTTDLSRSMVASSASSASQPESTMWMLILVTSARFAPLLRVPFAGWSARDGIKLTGEAGWPGARNHALAAGYRPSLGPRARTGNSPCRRHAFHIRPSCLGFGLRGLPWTARGSPDALNVIAGRGALDLVVRARLMLLSALGAGPAGPRHWPAGHPGGPQALSPYGANVATPPPRSPTRSPDSVG